MACLLCDDIERMCFILTITGVKVSVTKATVSTKNKKVSHEELQEQLLMEMKLGYADALNRMVADIYKSRFLPVAVNTETEGLTASELEEQRLALVRNRTDAKLDEMADRTWERLKSGKRPNAEELLPLFSKRPACQKSAIRDILRRLVREIEKELEGNSSEVARERELVA